MDTKANALQQKIGYDNYKARATEQIKEGMCNYHVNIMKPLLDRYVHQPKRILEIGFFDGRLMERMRKLYPNAEIGGTEVRPQFIEAMNCKGYHCHLVTDENIPEGDDYDLIYGTSVLHHFSEPYNFLRNAFSRLSSGGTVIFSCEPHRYDLPVIVYNTLFWAWNLEKHTFKLTKSKTVATARELTNKYCFYYGGNSNFTAFPTVNKVYEFFHLTKLNLLSEFHLALVHD